MIPVLTAIVPSIGVGLLFFLAIRAILRADSKERAALENAEKSARNPPENAE